MKKILVVEDDLLLSMLNTKHLQRMGHTVVNAVTNGKDAIESVIRYKPDIILMDIRIKGDMDGIETMMEISKFSNIPVIYLTGNSNEDCKARAIKTNMLAFCLKPVHLEELQHIISNS